MSMSNPSVSPISSGSGSNLDVNSWDNMMNQVAAAAAAHNGDRNDDDDDGHDEPLPPYYSHTQQQQHNAVQYRQPMPQLRSSPPPHYTQHQVYMQQQKQFGQHLNSSNFNQYLSSYMSNCQQQQYKEENFPYQPSGLGNSGNQQYQLGLSNSSVSYPTR